MVAITTPSGPSIKGSVRGHYGVILATPQMGPSGQTPQMGPSPFL